MIETGAALPAHAFLPERPSEDPARGFGRPAARAARSAPTSLGTRVHLALRSRLPLPATIAQNLGPDPGPVDPETLRRTAKLLRDHGWGLSDLRNAHTERELTAVAVGRHHGANGFAQEHQSHWAADLATTLAVLRQRWTRADAYCARLERRGVATVGLDDGDYPQILRHRMGRRAPGWLHVRGDLNALNAQRWSGSRWPRWIGAGDPPAADRPTVRVAEWPATAGAEEWCWAWCSGDLLRTADPDGPGTAIVSRHDPAASPSARARETARKLFHSITE